MAGLGYVLLTFAALALAPLPDLGSGAAAVQDFLTAAHAPTYVAGGCAALLAYASLGAFAVGVTRPGRSSGRGSTAASLALLGAGLGTAIIATAVALVGAVVLTPGVAVPVARVLLTAGSIATWSASAGLALTLAAIASLGRGGTGLPGWICRTAGALSLGLVVAIPLADLPVAHVPALLLDAWLLIVAGLLFRRDARSRA